MSKTKKYCNFKNAICLNEKGSGDKFKRDVKNTMKKINKEKIIVKPYSFYYKKKSEEHNVVLKFKQVTNAKIEILISGTPKLDDLGNDLSFKCLRMYFIKPDKYFNTWKESKIEGINRGKCQEKNKDATLSGGFILNLANKLNDILSVDFSRLSDDSKIETKCGNISIKMLHLIKYGKTWYEREGNFSLEDKKYYQLAKQIEEISVANLYKNLNDEDILNKMDKLLDKLGVKGRNIKIKNLVIKGFGANSTLSLCEQKYLYENTLQLPERYLNGNFKNLVEFGKLHYSWSSSVRKGKK